MQIDLQGVSARHPAARASAAPAVQGLSLQVAAGEQLAVIGPSGAGKTTLLQLLGCALRPSRGQVLLQGSDPGPYRAADCRPCAASFSWPPDTALAATPAGGDGRWPAACPR
jgi:phosphonate transport system ATP-binding protein